MSDALRRLVDLARSPVPDPVAAEANDNGSSDPSPPEVAVHSPMSVPAAEWPWGFGDRRPSYKWTGEDEPRPNPEPPSPEAIERLARELMEQMERVGVDANSCMSRGVRITDRNRALDYFRGRAIAELTTEKRTT